MSRPLSELDPLDLDQDVADLASEPSPGDAVIEHDAVPLELWVVEFEDDTVVVEESPGHVDVICGDGERVSCFCPLFPTRCGSV